ncbi:MAG: acylphosphatase [Pigmentiphaga sp.]|nr:acylphosphatase [Pigmentiphaga sp.]
MSFDSTTETLLIRVTGKVQGVGFRFSTLRRAHSVGATGWVRNNEDGSVEALVQGNPEQVDHMLEWMRQGPPGARVDTIEHETLQSDRVYRRFEQQ